MKKEESSVLHFAPMKQENIKDLMETRNECRTFLFNTNELSLSDAGTFYEERVKKGLELILIAYHDGNCIGYFNAKPVDGNLVYDCGYKLKKKYRGRGYATRMLEMFCNYMRLFYHAKVILCEVLDNNAASIKVCEKNNFIPAGEKEINGKKVLVYMRRLDNEINYRDS